MHQDDHRFLLSLNLSNPDDCRRYSQWLTEQDKKNRIGKRFDIVDASASQEDNMRTLNVRERIARQIQGYGTVVVETPNAYASVTENRETTQSDLTPDLDPNYKPHGTPPDSYAIALALREAKKEMGR